MGYHRTDEKARSGRQSTWIVAIVAARTHPDIADATDHCGRGTPAARQCRQAPYRARECRRFSRARTSSRTLSLRRASSPAMHPMKRAARAWRRRWFSASLVCPVPSSRSATISSNRLATLRFELRAASSRLAFISEDTRHVYTSVFLGMHYMVVQGSVEVQIRIDPRHRAVRSRVRIHAARRDHPAESVVAVLARDHVRRGRLPHRLS